MTILLIVLIVITIILIYTIFSLLIVHKINKAVFLIHGEDPKNPCFIRYEDYPDLKREAYSTFYQKKKINGYIYYLDKSSYKGLVILSHGLFGTHIQYLKDIYFLASNGYKVLAYDQYGCGISEGTFQEYLAHGIYLCKNVIQDVINRNINEDKEIILYGHSWGAYSICGGLAKYPQVSKAIIRSGPISPKISGKDLIKKINIHLYRILFIGYELAFYLLIPHHYRLKATIGPKQNKTTKCLFIQSKEDDLVFYKHSLARYYQKHKQENCKCLVSEKGPHNSIITSDGIDTYKKLLHEYNEIKKESELAIQNNKMSIFMKKLEDRPSLYPLDEEVSNSIIDFLNNN